MSNKSNSNSSANKADNQFLKEQGFNSMRDFAASYGEKATPDGYDNAKVILGAMREGEKGSAAGGWYQGEKKGGREPTLK